MLWGERRGLRHHRCANNDGGPHGPSRSLLLTTICSPPGWGATDDRNGWDSCDGNVLRSCTFCSGATYTLQKKAWPTLDFH